jgi:hypothetical protein
VKLAGEEQEDVKRQETLGETDGVELELEAGSRIGFRFRETTIRLAGLDMTVNKCSQLGFG